MKARPDVGSLTSHHPDPQETSQQMADRMQIELIELVDDFCTFSTTGNPINCINELLYRWLTSPVSDLVADDHDKLLLRAGQDLINFLTALTVYLKDLRHFQQEAEKEVQGE